jgi:4-carboxymuconolactone decarboxylase
MSAYPLRLRTRFTALLLVGITREELIEVLMQTACYAGVPAAVNALNAAADVLGAPKPAA